MISNDISKLKKIFVCLSVFFFVVGNEDDSYKRQVLRMLPFCRLLVV